MMLAQQHADAGIKAEVVQLDISEGSIAVARARIEVRGLSNACLVRGLSNACFMQGVI
ncbi:MAG: class I SAM-dependent methyltransferase [Rickettsiales bacterium]